MPDMSAEPRLQTEPRGGVPDVTDTPDGFRRACEALSAASGPLAADAERASGFRYGHEDWLVQFKRPGSRSTGRSATPSGSSTTRRWTFPDSRIWA